MSGVSRSMRYLACLWVPHTTSPLALTSSLLHLPSYTSCPHTVTSLTQRWHGVSQCVGSRLLSSTPPTHSHTPTPPATEPDEGPGTWQEIYHGVLTTQIRIVKTFSLSTSILGLCVQPMIFKSELGSHLGVALAVGSFVGFFTFVTPFLIHWISKKYVTTLHYDKARDLYVATTLSFFLRQKKLEFQVSDVHVPEIPGPFTTLYAHSRPLFLDPHTFSKLDHYGRLMGYDKPIDLHMGTTGDEEEEEEARREEKKI